MPIGYGMQRPVDQYQQGGGAKQQCQKVEPQAPYGLDGETQIEAFASDKFVWCQAAYQRITPWPYQVVGGCIPTVLGGCLCPAHHRLGYYQLGLPGVTRHFFHGLRDLLSRAFAVQYKTGQKPQRLQGAADRFNQLAPVNLANKAQAVDDVADGQVG